MEYLIIIVGHVLSDVISQCLYKLNFAKNTKLHVLGHTLLYTTLLSTIWVIIPLSIGWIAVNSVLHFISDYNTFNKINALHGSVKLEIIAALSLYDQILHVAMLLITYMYLVHPI